MYCALSWRDCYTELNTISTINENRTLEAKVLREQYGGENQHEEQCDLVHDIIDHSMHTVHIQPINKTFTMIISQHRKKSDNDELRKSSRLSSPP